MKRTFILLALALAGCTSEGDRAAERYALLSRNEASFPELCRAATEARDAFAKVGDENNYRYWQTLTESNCTIAARRYR